MIPPIQTIDLLYRGHPQATAVYLLEAPAGPLLIESGPSSTLAAALQAIADLGYRPVDIRHVLLTHIHLDHAGAAGWWASQGATIYVHPVGAPHLIDPSRLIHSATRIYGDQMDTLWGEILPVPASQLVEVPPNALLQLNGLSIRALDTPGHANHHYTYAIDDIAFTGDAAGMTRPGSPVVDVPAAPPEFDLERWLATVDLLAAQQFRAIYPTHFGRIDAVAPWLAELKVVLRSATAFVGDQLRAGKSQAEIIPLYEAWFRARASAAGGDPALLDFYVLTNPVDMSVSGIVRYWQKKGLT